MAKTWKQFMKRLDAEAKAGGPEHVNTLRVLRRHYWHFGGHLAQERKKLEMSQEALSKATGIGQAEISRIERDLVDPRLGTYLKLLEGMGLGLKVEPLTKGSRTNPRSISARRARG